LTLFNLTINSLHIQYYHQYLICIKSLVLYILNTGDIMQKEINYHYKTYDFCNNLDMDKKIYGTFNEYGYNFDSTSKRIIDYEETCCKSLNNNLKNHGIKVVSKK